MNYGHFFMQDQDASYLTEGIAVFNYIALKAYEGEFNGRSPKYPVFLIFSKDAVEFRVHYCVYNCEKEEKDETCKSCFIYNLAECPNGYDSDKLKIEHVENLILSLPLSMDYEIKDNLTTVLKSIYDTDYPVSFKRLPVNYEYNYLGRLLDQACHDITPSEVTFSSLEIFGLIKNGKYVLRDNKARFTKFLRKLVLDFMFDLKHSSVFQNISGYEEIAGALRRNFFFLSLINKANFYYYREVIKQHNQEKYLNRNSKIDRLRFDADFLDKAEEKWLECIQNPKADVEFLQDPLWYEEKKTVFSRLKRSGQRWFESPGKELKHVYYGYKGNNLNSLNLYSIINAYQYPYAGVIKRFFIEIVKGWGFILVPLICLGVIVDLGDPEWFLRFFHFQLGVEKWGFWPWCIFIVLILCPIILLKYMTHATKILEYRASRVSQWCIHRYDFGNVLLNMCGLPIGYIVMLLTLGLIFIAVVFNISWGDQILSRTPFFKWLSCFIIIYNLVVNIYYKFIPLTRFSSVYRAFRGIHILLPRLAAAIITAWLSITLSEDLFKGFFDLSRNSLPITKLILFSVIIAFVYFEIGKIVPYLSSAKRVARSLALVMIGFFYAFVTGFLFIAFTGDKFLERSGYLEDFYKYHVLTDSSKFQFIHSDGFLVDEFYSAICPNKYADSILFKTLQLAYTSPVTEDSVLKELKFNFSDLDNKVSNKSEFIYITKYLVDQFNKAIEQRKENLSSDEKMEMLWERSEDPDFINYRTEYVWEILKKTNHESLNLKLDTVRKENLESSSERCKTFLGIIGNNALYLKSLNYLKFNGNQTVITESFNLGKVPYTILWEFLVQFSFFAMFIGIFLQLIFEDKPVTEPI